MIQTFKENYFLGLKKKRVWPAFFIFLDRLTRVLVESPRQAPLSDMSVLRTTNIYLNLMPQANQEKNAYTWQYFSEKIDSWFWVCQ